MNRVRKELIRKGKAVARSGPASQRTMQTHEAADDQSGRLEKQIAGATSDLGYCSRQDEHSMSRLLVSTSTEVDVKLCLASGSGFMNKGSDPSGICTVSFLGGTRRSKVSGVESHVSGDTR